MYEEIPIFFAGIILLFSILYCSTKCYIRKRSRSISDENHITNV